VTVKIRLAQGEQDIDIVQGIYNSKENVNYLGGFTLRTSIELKMNTYDIIIANLDGKDVAASEIGRNGTQRTSLQLVAVLEDYRRMHLASKMYWTWTLITAVQGRLHLTDHIISNNPVMPHVLPTLGFKHSAELRSKVRRHHSMNLWCYDLTHNGLSTFHNRIQEIGNDIEFDESLKQTISGTRGIENLEKNINLMIKTGQNPDILKINRMDAMTLLGWNL